MKLQRYWKQLIVWTVVLTLSRISLCCTAMAAETIDTSQTASLSVWFGKEESGFSEAEFSLYRAADMSGDGEWRLAGAFKNYPVSLEGLESSGWRALAQTLDAYAARDHIEPSAVSATDQAGFAAFDSLSSGLYLVSGENFREGRYTYRPEPLLVAIPGKEEDGSWTYDVNVSCKYEREYDAPPGGGGGDGSTTTRKVLKIWEDNGEENRPEKIQVQLLRDGQVYDTVTLGKENNWRYTWTGLEKGHVWRMAEQETPAGYTVSVVSEGITFVMTNTRRPPGDEPEEPSEPGKPPETEIPPGPEDPPLPQTGVLWWPVPFLACGGVFLFLIGWGKRKYEDE